MKEIAKKIALALLKRGAQGSTWAGLTATLGTLAPNLPPGIVQGIAYTGTGLCLIAAVWLE